MGLFRALNVGASGLHANTLALQVTGNNIANANNEGYSRQRVEMAPEIPQDLGYAQIGRGVVVSRIRRVIDETIQAALERGNGTLGDLSRQEETFSRLEALFNELTGYDLSTGFTRFYGGVEDLANDPSAQAGRQVFVDQAEAMARSFNQLGSGLRQMRSDLNSSLSTAVKTVNGYTREIAELNQQIVMVENGGQDLDTANDLRDRRDYLVRELGKLVDVRATETSVGAVNILAGGDYLVFGGESHALETEQTTDRDSAIFQVRFSDNGVLFSPTSGELAGLIQGRDVALPQYLDQLDELARTFIFEYNKIHASGMGRTRYATLTSVAAVHPASRSTIPLQVAGSATALANRNTLVASSLAGDGQNVYVGLEVEITSGVNQGERRRIKGFDDATGALVFDRAFSSDFAGGDDFLITSLDFPLAHGSFELKVVNENTQTLDLFTVAVDLDGLNGNDSTLQSVVADINAQLTASYGASNPLVARVTNDNRLEIVSSQHGYTFGFGEDTSHFLAAMGLNTLFTGSDAQGMDVNEVIRNDPNLVATGKSLASGDNTNLQAMIALRQGLLMDNGAATLDDFYQGMVGSLGEMTAAARDQRTNQEMVVSSLMNQRNSVSGVNVDEEVINMIAYQRAFQGVARYIGIVDQLLETLIASI